MTRIAGRGRPGRLRGQPDGGFTVPELMVVVGLLGLVMAMTYESMDVFLRLSDRTESGSIAAADARTAMERVTRQIRAANPIDPLVDPTRYSTKIAFSVHCSTPGVGGCGADRLRPVTYEVTGHTIVETVGTASTVILGPEGPASVPVADRRGAVVNSASQPVFRYFQQDGQALSPSASLATTFRDCTRSVEIHLVVVAQRAAAERVDLTTRVDLRNFNEVAGC
ncbi:MAG: PulJ/GspJ family protein [Actinomycetota bacterium]